MVDYKIALSNTDSLQHLGHTLSLIPLTVNGAFLRSLSRLIPSIWAVHTNAIKKLQTSLTFSLILNHSMSKLQQQLVQCVHDIGFIPFIKCLCKLWTERLFIDQKCGPDLFLRVPWWNFSLGKLKLDFTKHYFWFKPLSCRVGINWFGARESVKLTQNSFLQKFGCDICVFSSAACIFSHY